MNTQKSDYDEYIARKHASLVTSQEVIDSIIKKATGVLPISQKRLTLGETNEVYDIQLQDKNVILRIAHKQEDSFGKEKWALEQCKTKGVPVPEVLYVDDFEIDGNFRSVCVLEKLKGEPLRALVEEKRISKEELDDILLDAGKILSQIHTITPVGFGSLNEKLEGYEKSWNEYVLNRLYNRERYKKIAIEVGLDQSNIDEVLGILENHQEIYSSITPHLLHSDYGYEHIMVENNQITGIIDFGNMKSGDPVHDFAWWQFFYGDDERIQKLKEGYKNQDLFSQNFDTRLNICLLYLSLDLLEYYHHGNFQDGIDIAKRNMQKSLSFFEVDIIII